jgi:TRAP-type C4-dicarboxylate transport system permease small subunit
MIKLKKVLDKILERLIALLFIILVLDVVWQVVARYLLKNPSSFTDELAGYLLMWIGLLGAALVAGQKMHLAIDILTNKIRSRSKQVMIDKFVQIMIAFFALCVMIIGGGRLMYVTLILDQNSASLNIPLGIVYTVLPISGIFIVLYSMIEILNAKTSSSA